MREQVHTHYDVVILGAGLAGLALCRQLLLRNAEKRILIIDNRAEIPGKKQKVGESLVQVAGYYFTRLLDLEEHLLREHYPKYNLRFHWKTTGSENRSIEDYGQAYINKTSNVATYQLNRNKIEEHLLSLVVADPKVTLCAPASALKVELSEDSSHHLSFQLNGERIEANGEWLVDSTGRGQVLKRRQDLELQSPIQNGSSWCWVEGLVNLEKLTDASPSEIRRRRDREKQGLFPTWLATNHFCGEGFWFWVIPLKGLTSLGVVYDSRLFDAERVSTPKQLIQWACEEFPLFQRDLPHRRIIDSARLVSYAYDCRKTISASKWALSGMAGRFSDPLYSPGSDLISFYNTWITDAILEDDPEQLREKCALYEPLMKVIYEAYVPSYSVSYDVLGDQEVFTLKYVWELAVYFGFYAFPFINELFTDRKFIRCFFRKFAQLGPINRNLQQLLSGYYRWKKTNRSNGIPVRNDFLEMTALKKMEATYYTVGMTAEDAEDRLDEYLQNLKEFARFIIAYVASAVIGSPEVLQNRSYVSGLKLSGFKFSPDEIRKDYGTHSGCREPYAWKLDPFMMEKFRQSVVQPEVQSEALEKS